MPTITVITAVLNGELHLQQCIDSVRSQSLPGVDHVLIDGGSKDNTLAIIARNKHFLSHWESGRDSGISEAMNKGIAQAKGEWLLFLQSDDYLISQDALSQAILKCRSDVDVCGFPVQFGGTERSRKVYARGANFWQNFKTGFNHQGTLIRRSLFERIGDYDTGLRIAMDYEFFLRAQRSGARFATYFEPTIAVMRDTGVSSQLDWTSLRRRFAEEKRVHQKHTQGGLRGIYGAYWLLYLPYRRIRSILSRR